MLRAISSVVLLLSLLLPFAVQGQSGISSNRIVIGQSAAFSGPNSALGMEMKQGAEAYFTYINSKGGVHDRKIELISLDDGNDPIHAEENTRKLIEESKIFALFSYVGAAASTAALPVFTESEVPFFAPLTGAESLRRFNRYVFNVRASDFDETEKIVEHLVITGIKRIGVFYQNDAFGTAGLAGVEKALSKRDLKVLASGSFARNSNDVAAAVATIMSARPDAIIMISSYQSCAKFVRQAKKIGNTALFYSVSSVGSMGLTEDLGNESAGIAMSQIVPFPWSPSVPVVREYQQLMMKAGYKDFSFASLEGFISAKIFVEGLKRAGRDLTRKGFITALEGMHNVDMGGYYVNFAPNNHNGSRFVDLTIISREGKFKK